MIVSKFGGSLLSDADGIRRVCDHILCLDTPLVVVVSAFKGVTNLLEQVASTALSDPARARRLLAEAIDMHCNIATALLGESASTKWQQEVAPIIARLEAVVEGLGIVRELSGRTLDLVVSSGEQLSSTLIHEAVRRYRPEAARLSALDLVITDNTHRYARPDRELTRERVDGRLGPLLQQSGIVITEGYIARGTSGEATTMGRESSDYSATMLAELLGADSVHIYTSVPGIMTADPAVVQDASVIDHMSYSAANVLAELGAKILHPRTVVPVERAQIPMIISALDSPGTTIGPFGGNLPSVALLPDAERLQLELGTASLAIEPFIRGVAALTPVLRHERFRRRVQIVTAGPVDVDRLPLALLGEEPLSIERKSVAVVSVIREGGLNGAFLAGILDVLKGIPVLDLQFGIDPRAVSFIVERMDAVDVARALHRRLVEENRVV